MDLLPMKKTLVKARRKWRSLFARVNPRPVIALGKEKSGTTAIAALLAEHTGLSVTLDIRGIYEPMLSRLHSGEVRFERFVALNRLDFSRDIIKEPNLTLLYADVKRVFPDARYFMIVRDPRDNIRSILNRLGIPGDLEHLDLDAVPGLKPEWRLGLDGRWLGLRGENYIEMMAARWNRAADIYLERASEMRLLRYEDFAADKIGAITELARDLGLPHIRDIGASVDVQYQRRGNRAVSWSEFFGPANLARIERICGERMEPFDYRPSLVSGLRVP